MSSMLAANIWARRRSSRWPPQPASECVTASHSSPAVRLPKLANSSAASFWLRPRISMKPSRLPVRFPARAKALSRFAPSWNLRGYRHRRTSLKQAILTSRQLPPLAGVTMKYMLLCYDDDEAWEQAGQEALEEAMQEAVQLTHEINAKGQYIEAAPLEPVSTATSVRVRDGKRLVTDGPFAETREVLGGYYLIDVPSLDEAIRIAQRHPGARLGTVEIR